MMPNFKIYSDSQTFEFYTSDISGNYLIEFDGVTKDGKPIHLTSIFEVADSL